MFYYLDNFLTVLDWIATRYRDMLAAEELAFIEEFPALPRISQALLVRMAMRKGELFRASKLRYDEIGCPRGAAAALIAAGWIDEAPLLGIEHLFALLRKDELAAVFDFPPALKNARKDLQLAALLEDEALAAEARTLAAWHPEPVDDCVYHLRIDALCERLRLMFFGNLHQDWSEFVLSELGIFKYEKVALSAASQGFRSRQDIDDYLHLQRCRERFHAGETIDELLPAIPATAYAGDWLEHRRAKLLFLIAQQHERNGELADALRIYADCPWPGARMRMVRVLERCGQIAVAFEFAEAAAAAPESEAEHQQIMRALPRLRRQLGHAASPPRTAVPVARHDLTLDRPALPIAVEALVRDHLTQAGAPVLYVENSLINSLFGLLCWDAVFAPVAGAFFHPFQSAPADLLSPDFQRRRERAFQGCLAQLDGEGYRQTILRNFRDKHGIQSPFVYWDLLDAQLLALALDCLPAAHLRKWFERLLLDIRANRSGYPDLIQFWPDQRRYRMIEVKGPGDRLQDNQIRWLAYCAAHDMPVSVCYVQWARTEPA
ncbi:VRR-NUC domain-containing protein [Oxalobacteraceae bacterium CAVE-383]|nr:VRR-NUC domain-containing protein [Oxalobacteraceae bacterium CAVE-383]